MCEQSRLAEVDSESHNYARILASTLDLKFERIAACIEFVLSFQSGLDQSTQGLYGENKAISAASGSA
jgi:hypothetical protein